MPKRKKGITGDATRRRIAEAQRRRRQRLTEEELAAIRVIEAERQRKRRQKLTEEELAAMRVIEAERQRKRRQRLTEVEAAAERAAQAERQRKRRQRLTEEELAALRVIEAERQRKRRQRLTEVEAAAERAVQAERQRYRRGKIKRDQEIEERRQMAALRETYLSYLMQGKSNIEQTPNDPLHRIPLGNNIREAICGVPQNINSSQAALTMAGYDSYILPDSNVQNSSMPQTSNNDTFIVPFVTSTETCTSSTLQSIDYQKSQDDIISGRAHQDTSNNIDKNIKREPEEFTTEQSISLTSNDSSLIQQVHTLPVAKGAVDSSSATQTVCNTDPFTLPSSTNTNTYIVNPQNINSSQTALTSAAKYVKDLFKDTIHTQQVHIHNVSTQSPAPHCDVKHASTQVNFNEEIFRKMGRKVNHPLAGFTKYKKTKNREARKPRQAVVNGRRIIDFPYFLQELQYVNDHSKFSENICNLNNMFIKSERKNGICTCYYLKCEICDFETIIWSEDLSKDRNLNAEFVLGMLDLKCSFEATNKLLATMCLPSLEYADFIRECRKISKDKCSKLFNKRAQQNISNNLDNEKTKEFQKILNEEVAILSSSDESEAHQSTSNNVYRKEKRKSQKITDEEITTVRSSSDGSNLLEKIELNDLIIEDKFEIKEENTPENEKGTLLPQQNMKTTHDKLIVGQEQVTLNIAVIKKEIDSDLDGEDLSSSITSEIRTLNKESLLKSDTQSKAVLCQQKEDVASENRVAHSIINQKQVTLSMPINKEVCVIDMEVEELTSDTISKIEMFKKASLIENYKQSKGIFSQQKEVRASENRMATNEQIKFDNKEGKQNIYSVEPCERVAKCKVSEEERTMHRKRFKSSSETITVDQQIFAVNKNSEKILDTAQLSNPANANEILTIAPKKCTENRFESNRFISSKSTATDSGSVNLMSEQKISESTGSSASIASQITSQVAREIYKGEIAYRTEVPVANQKAASISNVALNASEATSMPSKETELRQSENSSTCKPTLNADEMNKKGQHEL